MLNAIPAVWLAGIPTAPAAVGSLQEAMLFLLALVSAAVALLIGASRRSLRRGRPAMHLRAVPSAKTAPASITVADAACRGLDEYRRFLAVRDGAADLSRHRLARREAFFAGLEAAPLRARAAVDAAAFRRNLRRRRPEPGLEPLLLWLLASAKANQAERFGVGFSELYGRISGDDDDPLRLHLHLQESYHTRILADVVALFGVTVHSAPPPPWTRALIELMVFAPPTWALPLVGCSEMIGCVLFRALRDRGLALLADDPAAAERVRLLYDEILADEISHVGFVAAQLGGRGRALMRILYRRLGMTMAKQMPELAALFGADELRRRLRDFQHSALLGEYPTTAYAAALI